MKPTYLDELWERRQAESKLERERLVTAMVNAGRASASVANSLREMSRLIERLAK